MIEAQRRHPAPAEPAAGLESAVPSDYVVVAIDQHRDIKAEHFDTMSDLSDLFFAVAPRVTGVRFQLIDPPINNL